MSTIEQIIEAQKAAQNKTEASKKASAASKSAAQTKATKERAKKTTAGDVEQSAFVAASNAGSELLQALGDFKRGRITKQEADKKLKAFNASLSVLKKLNPDRAKAVESAVLPPNVTAEPAPKTVTAPPAISNLTKKPAVKTATTSTAEKVKTAETTTSEPSASNTTPATSTSVSTAPIPVSTGTYLNPSTVEDKTASAIAKAIELYQMPDIIFNNVPELKKILDKYLAPTGAISLDQFIKEVGNSTWYRQNSKTIQNRYLQKFNYDELKKNGQVTGNTQYEQDIKKITENVISKARELGATDYTDPTAAQLIAEDLYIHNMETDATALAKRLAGGIRLGALGTTGAKGYTGSAQSNYQSLLSLAKNNGLTLRSILPSRLAGATDEELTNNVLKGLADGSIDMSTIEQTARILASQGQPQYIKDLLAQGYDLASVYAPYKQIMATTLDIDPNKISLNDPTLRMAITPNGDMNTYEYQKMLRKDDRWQYTQQAHQEVADATQKILQDFGFMG